MKEQKKWTIVLMTMAIFVMTTAFLPEPVRAGNLEPGNVPGSTMHTLDEIYTKLEQLTPEGSASVPQTGQIMMYAPGDDGDLRTGVHWGGNQRFRDNGDETVTDYLTGLMWTKDANLYGLRKWTDACNCCTYECGKGGHVDWRLPNVRELHSLVDYGRYDPAFPVADPFINVVSSWWWSSTTYAPDTSKAWDVSFIDGRVHYADKEVGYGVYVWCVRGGQ